MKVSNKIRAVNSAGECHPHTVEVAGSNPVPPTIQSSQRVRRARPTRFFVGLTIENLAKICRVCALKGWPISPPCDFCFSRMLFRGPGVAEGLEEGMWGVIGFMQKEAAPKKRPLSAVRRITAFLNHTPWRRPRLRRGWPGRGFCLSFSWHT